MATTHEQFWVRKPGKFDLADMPTKPEGDLEREAVETMTEQLGKEMEELLDLLFFAGKHGFLIVLQGMDTAGKDGTIRHMLRFTHAQSVRVASFKVPTPQELAHDFLWRCHDKTPGKGETVIFNRSHYEDVGVVRVHNLVDESVWKKRFDHINAFENLLVDSNTIVLKVFLHISKEEQEERLLEREQDAEDAWKLSVNDWKERRYWKEYQEAYSDAIGKCASQDAPWLVVPGDKKWFRNYIVTQAVVETLKPYREEWMESLKQVGKEAKKELERFRIAAPQK